ncbi:hypothetical protein BZA77DRAFT_301123 [Pyronema omphalodes]|nr:hypothetical protein BZA77DRAFT_301123 [Pyronema omphalodes]
MRFFFFVLPLLGATSLSAASPTTISAPPDFSITSITYGGSGCPQDRRYSTTSHKDGRTLTISIGTSDYIASTGPGVSLPESRKNCQINLRITYPSGFQFAIQSARYQGFMSLGSGVTATQKATYYFTGEMDQTVTEQSWMGQQRGPWMVDKDVGRLVWSSCAGQEGLNVDSQVRLEGGNSQSMISGSVNGAASYGLRLVWRRC